MIVRLVRTRPSPSHSGQGRTSTVPYPPQPGQTLAIITWPMNERVTWLTSPRPPQMSQVCGWVPGAVPSPEQVGQTTAVSTVSSLVAPNEHSASSSSILIVALRPRCARLRGPRLVAPPPAAPKNWSSRSFSGLNPAPNGPAPAPAVLAANGSTPMSYIRRLSVSDSTSYAWVISLNRSWVSGSGFTSGCSSRASRR